MALFEDRDLGCPGPLWWFTPGGGIDEGESDREAAVRELAEETGLRVTPEHLIGPVATRVAVHGFSDQVLVQTETFYALDVSERYVVDTSGFTAEERVTMLDHRWFTAAELGQVSVWPADLGELITADGTRVRRDGVVEESTIAVTSAEWELVRARLAPIILP